jgi:hypothetical protein
LVPGVIPVGVHPYCYPPVIKDQIGWQTHESLELFSRVLTPSLYLFCYWRKRTLPDTFVLIFDTMLLQRRLDTWCPLLRNFFGWVSPRSMVL